MAGTRTGGASTREKYARDNYAGEINILAAKLGGRRMSPAPVPRFLSVAFFTASLTIDSAFGQE